MIEAVDTSVDREPPKPASPKPSLPAAGTPPRGGRATEKPALEISSETITGDTLSRTVEDSKPSSQDTTPETEPLTWDNLWEAAYEKLTTNAEYSDLLERFERYLIDDKGPEVADESQGQSGPSQGPDRLRHIQQIATEKLEALPKARTSFTVGNERIVVRNVVQKTVCAISKFRSIINLEILAEPCCAVAWTGVMSMLAVSWIYLPKKSPQVVLTEALVAACGECAAARRRCLERLGEHRVPPRSVPTTAGRRPWPR